jgi:RimJ/RimL family protein N-acetyltransferase
MRTLLFRYKHYPMAKSEEVTIRALTESDAEAFLEMCRAMDSETKFMLLEPGERTLTVDEQRERIRSLEERENATILVAESYGQLHGYIFADGGRYQRNRHCAHIVIGIRAAHTGRGIGAKLIQAMFDWAARHRLTRLELTVMAHNERGINLYKKMGFEIEGMRRSSLIIDGQYVDEYSMSKLLDAA